MKKTLIGELPVEWECRRVEEICDTVSVGIVVRPAQLYRPTGIKCFRSANVSEGSINDSGWVYISAEANQANSKSILQFGDVLIVRTGAPGTACVVSEQYSGTNCIDLIFARPNAAQVLPDYLASFINSEFGRRQILSRQGGLAQQHLNVGHFTRMHVPVPPLSAQSAIEDILRVWDKVVALAEQQTTAKRQLKTGLMQKLLTGKRRFPEFGKGGKNGSNGWKTFHIADIAHEVTTRNSNGEKLPVLSCTKYDGLVDSLGYFGRRVSSADTSNYRVVRRGQFAYATNHIEEGSIGLLEHLDGGLVSPIYTVFETSEAVLPVFLYKLLKTEGYRLRFAAATSSSVNRRGSLRWSHFSRIRVSIPPLDEQRRIVEFIEISEREIALLEKQLDCLREQKKGLMQKLLTGKVRVKMEGAAPRASPKRFGEGGSAPR